MSQLCFTDGQNSADVAARVLFYAEKKDDSVGLWVCKFTRMTRPAIENKTNFYILRSM